MKKNKTFGEKYISALNNEGIRVPKKGLKWTSNFTPPTEDLIGITPKESEKISLFSKYHDTFVVHKSAKNGKSSFQITKVLLDNLMETQKQIGKNPRLIISIQNYILTCDLRKNNENV